MYDNSFLYEVVFATSRMNKVVTYKNTEARRQYEPALPWAVFQISCSCATCWPENHEDSWRAFAALQSVTLHSRA